MATVQSQPEAGHVEQMMAGPVTTDPALAATGEDPLADINWTRPPEAMDPDQQRLQDILPQIKDLAHRVGGLQKLADLVATLQESKE